jgi:hypothetical protein
MENVKKTFAAEKIVENLRMMSIKLQSRSRKALGLRFHQSNTSPCGSGNPYS